MQVRDENSVLLPGVTARRSDGALLVGSSQIIVTSVQIALGAALSTQIDLGTARLARIVVPAGWDAADLTVRSSPDGVANNYFDLYDSFGTEYTIKAAASRSILVPLADFISIRYLQLRSGKAAAAVNQTAARTLTLILVP